MCKMLEDPKNQKRKKAKVKPITFRPDSDVAVLIAKADATGVLNRSAMINQAIRDRFVEIVKELNQPRKNQPENKNDDAH